MYYAIMNANWRCCWTLNCRLTEYIRDHVGFCNQIMLYSLRVCEYIDEESSYMYVTKHHICMGDWVVYMYMHVPIVGWGAEHQGTARMTHNFGISSTISSCVYSIYTWTLRHSDSERKIKQHNTTQQDLRQLFQRKKLHSGGTRTCTSAGWVWNHLYTPKQQSEHLNLINRWIQTQKARIFKPPKTPCTCACSSWNINARQPWVCMNN